MPSIHIDNAAAEWTSGALFYRPNAISRHEIHAIDVIDREAGSGGEP